MQESFREQDGLLISGILNWVASQPSDDSFRKETHLANPLQSLLEWIAGPRPLFQNSKRGIRIDTVCVLLLFDLLLADLFFLFNVTRWVCPSPPCVPLWYAVSWPNTCE